MCQHIKKKMTALLKMDKLSCNFVDTQFLFLFYNKLFVHLFVFLKISSLFELVHHFKQTHFALMVFLAKLT